MRVCMTPSYQGDDNADGGIRRVVDALRDGLPAHDIELVAEPDSADLIACHGTLWDERPGIPVVSHNHGAYWREYQFPPWAERANAAIREALIRSDAATVPSQWVQAAYARGIWTPTEVIYHGIDAASWAHQLPSDGYVLWNKARVDSVSDPSAMQRVAERLPNVPFLATFGDDTANVKTIGALPYPQLKPIIQRAGVYLATARETFGIGTLEALAAGVPVVGWDYGGQREIIIPGDTGILVPEGDEDALAGAIVQALQDRARMSANAREDARARWQWADKVAQYADLYRRTLATYHQPQYRVAIVITTYNLNRYLADAVRSALSQGSDVQVIVIDDCGTEDASAITQEYQSERLSVVRLPENLGLSGARNVGAQRAQSRYLLFLDADDMLAPGAAATLADALDRDRGIAIAAGRLETMTHDGLQRRLNAWPGTIDYRLQMTHLNQLHYAAMWRRASFLRTGGYRDRDWRAEDAALWCRAIGFGAHAGLVTESVTLSYRMRNDSKSREEARHFDDRDGDWTHDFPWRVGAASGAAGAEMAARGVKLDPRLTPFGAPVVAPRWCYPISHRESPLVSIIIPVGSGHARYLVDALDSVQAQTIDAWEVVVVNDSGTALDLTGHTWARRIDTAGGMGAGFARNAGLAAARAPLVLFLDADDMLTPHALAELLRAYATGDATYVYGDTAIWEPGTPWDAAHGVMVAAEYDQLTALTHGYTEGRRGLHSVTALVETDAARAVGGFDEQMPGWEDWEFFLRLAAAGSCGQRVPAVTLLYRLHTGQRRETALSQADDLRAYLADRYAAYGEGTRMAKKCCGGRMTVQAQVQPVLDDAAQAPMIGSDEATVANGRVRLRYVGPHQGEHSIFGRSSGEVYRVGNNQWNRYANVAVGDVEDLLVRRDEVGDPLFEVVR